jgi:hypothetical protein
MLDSFYLAMVPWFRLHLLNIEGFERVRDRTTTTLEGFGNRLDIDWEKKNYSVILDGAEVARDNSTFCPLGENRIAMYAIAASPLVATLPSTWDTRDITAKALFADRTEQVKFDLAGRRVTVQMQARRPVMIYRGRAAS